jgi:hypothetical protein
MVSVVRPFTVKESVDVRFPWTWRVAPGVEVATQKLEVKRELKFKFIVFVD